MSSYSVEVKRAPRKQLERLPRKVQNQIYESLLKLADNPRPYGVTKIAGTTNRYWIRLGDYRVVYDIFDETGLVDVVAIGHRKVVYRYLSLLLLLLR